MSCEECRELMLEADPELLTGIGDEPLAAHLNRCDVCRDAAAAMLRQVQLARTAYQRIEPVSSPPRRVMRFSVRRSVWVVASLAAAAVITVVATRPAQVDLHGGHWVDLPDATSVPLAVDVPEGKSAIVFDTKNPNISVVWIY